jgi:hypothetical protein
MGKFNNCLVLALAQLIYVFMGMEPDQELKYSVGWYYNALVITMVVANLAVVVKFSIDKLVLKFKYHLLRCKKRCQTKEQKPFNMKFELAKLF